MVVDGKTAWPKLLTTTTTTQSVHTTKEKQEEHTLEVEKL